MKVGINSNIEISYHGLSLTTRHRTLSKKVVQFPCKILQLGFLSMSILSQGHSWIAKMIHAISPHLARIVLIQWENLHNLSTKAANK